ncbi:MAG TPA: aldo/keto reductase [Pseudonocardiaceae bacterium]|jgi:2,5-diketo-D-gluconate reductase A|nr:aldo/keto reductase [Pseudonocardiaceae bacterium]
MASIPNVTLNDGATIPQFGFGVFQIDPSDTAAAVRTALDAGYRHIDTAQMYGNEREVRAGIAQSGVPREDVFITTKLANDRHGRDSAITALDESLNRLGTDYVDLYLIHWPRPRASRYVETWTAFEQLAEAGKARSIGVSNFQPAHLDALAAHTDTVPAVNQVELHPALQQAELRRYDREHGIATEAWSPIAQGKVLDEPVLTELAQRYGKTPAQVALRWHIQLGNIIFPKSVTPERIKENIDIFDFELSEVDLAAIGTLERAERTGPDPEKFPRD